MAILNINREFVGDPNIVHIRTDNTLAEITTAGYLTSDEISANILDINKGEFQWLDTDQVLISYEPDFLINWFKRDATNNTFTANPAAGGLSNSLLSGRIFVGNAGNVATGVAMSGDIGIDNTGATSIGNNKILSAMMTPSLLKYTTVAISDAEFNGMYAAPVELIAAPGADNIIILQQMQLVMTYDSAAFADGGVTAIQYDSTANGAGIIASTTLSAATFQATANTVFTFNAGVVPLPFTTTVNKGLYLSNLTGAFTTGNSDFFAHIWYRIISTLS